MVAKTEDRVGAPPQGPVERPDDAEVELVEALGAELLVHLRLAGTGAPFVARFPPRSTVGVGETVKVIIDLPQVHLFDPATGLARSTR